jgi:hypothetical protein
VEIGTLRERARQFETETRRIRALVWWSGTLLMTAIGLAVGYLWTFAVGIPAACALELGWLALFRRLAHAALIKRIPELGGDQVRWQPRDFP